MQFMDDLAFANNLAMIIGWLSITTSVVLVLWCLLIEAKTAIQEWIAERRRHACRLDGIYGPK